ncbi:MAG: hypothetical protein NZ899_12895 [Thermoguttaceae bacterium]|nr:hypothetical protein [Thermoguttaceae bacterium]MDW8079967.1 hypothetical protein [Thermoguttaceae bacterium]
MPTQDPGIRKVIWSEVLPWLLLFRVFRIARRVRLLLLATAAIVVTAGGWAIIDALFHGVGGLLPSGSSGGVASLGLDLLVPDRPSLEHWLEHRPTGATLLDRWPDPIFGTWEQFSRPLIRLVTGQPSLVEMGFWILAGLWAIGVWGYFGGAICRTAALALARDEYITLRDCLAHARKKWLSHLGAPLVPLVPVVLAVVGLGVMGLLLRTDWGALILALMWPIVLIVGLGVVLLGVGVLLGWPLMWGTLATENADAFDAVSRSFSYLFQRPLNYLFYAIVAGLFGIICWLVVANIAAATVFVSAWAVDWGADLARWTTATLPVRRNVESMLVAAGKLTAVGFAASNLLGFWKALVKLVAMAFLYSYFWTSACAIYLLLRRDVDATEIEEIYLGDRPTVSLPEIKPPEAKAPAPPPVTARAVGVESPAAPPPPPPVQKAASTTEGDTGKPAAT